MSTAAVKRYWSRVAALGCIICTEPAEIAHCHGGSIVERGCLLGRDYSKARGKKLPYMDWLVLPLCPAHHRLSDYALDLNVGAWEERYGSQATHIDRLIGRLGVPVWALAHSRHDLTAGP